MVRLSAHNHNSTYALADTMPKKQSGRRANPSNTGRDVGVEPRKQDHHRKTGEQPGVSEAALYRHFPSKTRMYESLIDFVEDTLFTRITQILSEETKQLARCKHPYPVFDFCERNPITRILSGDALMGEHERLRDRVSRVYDRIETQLRQCLRMAELEEGWRTAIPVNTSANMLLATAEEELPNSCGQTFPNHPRMAGKIGGQCNRRVVSRCPKVNSLAK